MLYLLTGQPGSGKTNYMVSQLLKNPDLRNRALYVDGITDLDHEQITYFDISEGCSVETWPDWLPDGAVLIVDECQRYFRPRPSDQPPPAYITELETHRHRGVDFFFITQHTRLIDVNVRSFVENHKHFGKTQLGTRRFFEWQRCGDTDSHSDAKLALVKVYRLDKSVYPLYTSASEHVKIRVNHSRWLYVFPIALLLLVYFVYLSVVTVSRLGQSQSSDVVSDSAEKAESSDVVSDSAEKAETPVVAPLVTDVFESRILGRPWTAPAYDHLLQVKSVPYPVGCLVRGDYCACYTAQATPINVDEQFCRDFVDNHVFNPYRAPSVSAAHGKQLTESPVQ